MRNWPGLWAGQTCDLAGSERTKLLPLMISHMLQTHELILVQRNPSCRCWALQKVHPSLLRCRCLQIYLELLREHPSLGNCDALCKPLLSVAWSLPGGLTANGSNT